MALAAALAASSACNGPNKQDFRSRAADFDGVRASYNAHFAAMVEAGNVEEMTLADIHFIPHTVNISDTGLARLDSLMPYLMTYGGTLRYSTNDTEMALVDGRLAHVRDYLDMSGCDMEQVAVKSMMSAGRGMSAETAISARERMLANEQSGAPEQGGGFLPTGMGGSGQ